MFQKKGHIPEKELPNFKMVIPVNTLLLSSIRDKLLSLGVSVNVPIEKYEFLYHRNGEIGIGISCTDFLISNLKEFSYSDLKEYEHVPVKLTIKEIESLLGHQIIILEEKS